MQQALRMKEFSPIWCNWVQGFVQGGNAGIKVNGQLRPYFKTRKGLREGDSLSPILFNIVVHMLAITIARAKEYDHMVYHFCNMWMTQIFLWTMILNKQKI